MNRPAELRRLFLGCWIATLRIYIFYLGSTQAGRKRGPAVIHKYRGFGSDKWLPQAPCPRQAAPIKGTAQRGNAELNGSCRALAAARLKPRHPNQNL
jgi:hypothetical protein